MRRFAPPCARAANSEPPNLSSCEEQKDSSATTATHQQVNHNQEMAPKSSKSPSSATKDDNKNEHIDKVIEEKTSEVAAAPEKADEAAFSPPYTFIHITRLSMPIMYAKA